MPYFDNDYPAIVGDNPRAYKVNRTHNGKLGNVSTMIGVSRSTLASKPSLRIAQNYYIEIDCGYVELYFCATATRLQHSIDQDGKLGNVKPHLSDRYGVRVGRIVNGEFWELEELTDRQWYLLACRVFPNTKYPSVSQLKVKLSKAVNKAVTLDPKLCLHRDRTDNARYARPVKPISDRTVGNGITIVNKTPKPSTVRALEKRKR